MWTNHHDSPTQGKTGSRSSREYAVLAALLYRAPPFSILPCPPLLMTFPASPPPVRSVPGRPVSRHGRPRSRSGGRGVVRREKRRPHPDLAQRRLRLHEEPGSESGQDERPGDQASHKSRKHPDCPEACFSTALSSECECINVSYFPVCSFLSLL